MRKTISILLAGALLAVSAVPLIPATAMACSSTDKRVDGMAHGASMNAHAGHRHNVAPAGDWQSCRIECGCGCHRSIDSLPHLLAPHTVALDGFHIEMVATDASADAAPVLQARLLVFPTPPPRHS